MCGLVTHVRIPCSGLVLEEDGPAAMRTTLNETELSMVAASPPESVQGSGSSSSPFLSLHENFRVGGPRLRLHMQGSTMVFNARSSILSEVMKPDPTSRHRRSIVIRELLPSLANVTSEEEGALIISPKKIILSLAVGKRTLQLERATLGLVPEKAEAVTKRKRAQEVPLSRLIVAQHHV